MNVNTIQPFQTYSKSFKSSQPQSSQPQSSQPQSSQAGVTTIEKEQNKNNAQNDTQNSSAISSQNNFQNTSPNNSPNNSILDKFETNIRNSADMNDTIKVPRTIFKGYLAFCAGSALMPVASMIKNKLPKTSNALNVINAGLIVYGTYSFVRPYLVTQNQKPDSQKTE